MLSVEKRHTSLRPFTDKPHASSMVLRAGHDRFGKRSLVERPTARGGRVPIADAAVGFTNRNLVKLIELVDALAIDNLDAMLLAAGEMAVIVALAESPALDRKDPAVQPIEACHHHGPIGRR